MNEDRQIRDPHFRRFTVEAADAIEAAVSEMHVPLPRIPALTVAELLSHVVPRPIQRAALDGSEG